MQERQLLTFLVKYLSPLKLKLVQPKCFFFGRVFTKIRPFKIAMSRLASCVGCHPRFIFLLLFWKNLSIMPLVIFLVPFLVLLVQRNFDNSKSKGPDSLI